MHHSNENTKFTASMQKDSNNTETDVLQSECLFRGQLQRVIAHAGEHYILRITKQGKLILTK